MLKFDPKFFGPTPSVKWAYIYMLKHQSSVIFSTKFVHPWAISTICLGIFKFSWSVSAVFNFAKLRSPHCYFSVWLIWFHWFGQSILPNCRVHVVMSAFPSHQLHIANAMWPNYQVHFTMPTAWNEIQTAHKYKYFWGVQCLNLFFSLLKLLPHKLTLPLFVSHSWLLKERLALWKFVHKIASMKLHPFPHWKSTNVILQMFIHGIWLLMQKINKILHMRNKILL